MSSESVFGRARAALGPLPETMEVLAELTLGKAERIVAHHPDWPLIRLPERLAAAYEIQGARRDALLAGGVLLYAAADVIDDAQDGDLGVEPWGDPPFARAVNLGNAFLFASLGAFLDAASDAAVAGLVAWDFSQAGIRMAIGQHRDFDLALGGPSMTEQQYLACVEGKSGASLGLFCRLAGLCGHREEREWDTLEDLGICLGTAVQIRSDVGEIWNPGPNRDRGKRTLPILFASTALAQEEIAPLILDSSRQSELVALLDRCGAGGYCELRIESYLRRAREDLDKLYLPAEIRAEIDPILDAIRQGDRPAL